MPTETQVDKEQELRTELAKVEQTAAITITNQETYDRAANALLAVKSWRKSWKSYWYGSEDNPGPITLANRSWKSLLNKFGERDEPAEKLEKSLGRQILSWDDAQRRLQEERQREAQRKAEADEEARRAQLAFELEESGAAEEEIESLMQAPVVAVAEPVEPTYQKAQGVSRRENWKARVTDLKKLCKAIGAGKVPVEYVEPNMTALNARAKADKSTLDLPGVEAYDEPVIAGRSR